MIYYYSEIREKIIMKVVCPYCNAITKVAEATVSRHNLRCQCCGHFFFAAGELTFRYGEMLDSSSSGSVRIACPYCRQHYSIDYIPFHNMIGCFECLKIFVLPKKEPDAEVQPSDKTIVISPHPFKKPSQWKQNPENSPGRFADPIPVLWSSIPTSSQGSIQTASGSKPAAAIKPPNWQKRN